jgi:hypothetical protein
LRQTTRNANQPKAHKLFEQQRRMLFLPVVMPRQSKNMPLRGEIQEALLQATEGFLVVGIVCISFVVRWATVLAVRVVNMKKYLFLLVV